MIFGANTYPGKFQDSKVLIAYLSST
ncbi:unnamed protein product, partial [Rotaria sordida]